MMTLIAFFALAAVFLQVLVVSASTDGNQNTIQQEVTRKLAAGEPSNRLINEQSPYLLQHAFNPVQWYPWGEEAFNLAKKENKPVFLSIGYSTCHWCHVMAHESFEDPETAAILNTLFVSIKVDREERPDIDQLYMAATQAMTGGGGWPMSVFLLPDGSPFYAGTYFPLEGSTQRPGFKDVLWKIHEAWKEKIKDISRVALEMVEGLKKQTSSNVSPIRQGVLENGYEGIKKNFDHENGGFSRAPKFPRPVTLTYMFAYYLSTEEEQAKNMVLTTLDKMAWGGIYDHLGGGFHRYSVDEQWFVPHFEKMLYDQAQLVGTYLDAYQITKDSKYAIIARDIFSYCLGPMLDQTGGFYSAEDADSDNPYAAGEHGEGAFYLWTQKDIVAQLGKNDGQIFSYFYDVQDNGNVKHDPGKEFVNRNIIHRTHDSTETAAEFNLTDEEVAKTIARSKKTLVQYRNQRKRPHLDDKVITAWNGLMVGVLARGSLILQNPQLLEQAEQTVSFIKSTLYDEKLHTLKRRYRQTKAGLAGQIDDYAFLVAGLLDLYQVNHEPQYLRWAMDLTKKQIELFWNETGGFFFDSVADPTLKVRMSERYDGAEPAGNSVAALNLLRLGQLRNKSEWITMAHRVMQSFSQPINDYPPAVPLMLTAWLQYNSKPKQVVIAGKRGAEDTNTLLKVAASTYDPSRIVLLADGDANQAFLAEKLPFLHTIVPLDGRATAYVCRDFTCKMPVTDPDVLLSQLKAPVPSL